MASRSGDHGTGESEPPQPYYLGIPLAGVDARSRGGLLRRAAFRRPSRRASIGLPQQLVQTPDSIFQQGDVALCGGIHLGYQLGHPGTQLRYFVAPAQGAVEVPAQHQVQPRKPDKLQHNEGQNHALSLN